MNRLKLLPLIICFSFVLSSCLDTNTGTPTTKEMVTFENYYVDNQSNSDLTLIYKLEAASKDSTVSIPGDTTILILKSGGIGGGSTPYSTFSNFRFYKKSSDTSTPFLTIEPVQRSNLSDRWNITPGNDDKPAKYVLTITNEDLQ